MDVKKLIFQDVILSLPLSWGFRLRPISLVGLCAILPLEKTMLEAIKYLVDHLSNGAAILLVILLTTLWSVYMVSKFIERFSHHESKLKGFDGLSERVVKIEGKVDLIYMNTVRNPVALPSSPIALTPVGKEISDAINGPKIFKSYRDKLIALVDAECPKTAYDIQVCSMKIAREKIIPMLDAEEINSVKNVAFQKGLLAEDIMAIFGVMLRDDILKEKGIPVAEVDAPQSV